MSVKSIIFDCDGVILDSNTIKSDLFYQVALPYGDRYANALVHYHRVHGGISRFEKFKYFFSHILKRQPVDDEYEQLIDTFHKLVIDQLCQCSTVLGIESFLDSVPQDIPCFVVSGGFEDELRVVFQKRGLSPFFKTIYGSPRDKFTILSELTNDGHIDSSSLYFGDSKYDYDVSKSFNLNFIFVSRHSEFKEHLDFFRNKKIVSIPDFNSLSLNDILDTRLFF